MAAKVNADNELIDRTKALLRAFHDEGQKQIEIFKELNPGSIERKLVDGRMMGKINGLFMPIEDVARRVGTQEEIFLHNILLGFWNYYLLNLENIESAARQGIDRTLLELCYQKLVTFIKATSEEKKRILLVNSICDVGMVLSRPSKQDASLVSQFTDDYNFWVASLEAEADRNWFKQLQVEKYPTHAYAQAKHKLWPSFFKAYKDNASELIFPWADDSVESRERARKSFLETYQHQHDFVHGSYTTVLTALDAMKSRRHLFTSVIVSTQVGYQVLYTMNQTYLGERALNLDELHQGAAQLVPLLAKDYSFTTI